MPLKLGLLSDLSRFSEALVSRLASLFVVGKWEVAAEHGLGLTRLLFAELRRKTYAPSFLARCGHQLVTEYRQSC